jgi:hypothetical protein
MAALSRESPEIGSPPGPSVEVIGESIRCPPDPMVGRDEVLDSSRRANDGVRIYAGRDGVSRSLCQSVVFLTRRSRGLDPLGRSGPKERQT